MPKSHDEIVSRNAAFVAQTATRIWHEEATQDNPFIAESCRCHGYDLAELIEKRSFVDVFYLLFRGELPTKEEAQLLNALMIALINPGPRHPATRAAQNTGIGKSDAAHILPISLSVLGGSHMGAGEVEPSMRFLRKHNRTIPQECARDLLKDKTPPKEGDWVIAPGFGSYFGDIDVLSTKTADYLCTLPAAGKVMLWANQFAKSLHPSNMSWLPTGIAAATFADLGFQPRAGAGLFQALSSPGLLAHGVELANKPITAMPRVGDEDYVIEET